MDENDHLQHGPAGLSSDELLNLVVESATDLAIIALDMRGVVRSWNLGAERLLGYAESEILGKDGDIIFTAEDRAAGAPERERTVTLAQGRAEDERWHVRKDGSRFWGSGLLMPLADRSGFVKVMRDLTIRKIKDEQLRTSEELFRVLATNVPQLVFRTRGSGERTWGSPQWIVFTGLSFEESLGFGWLDAIHPDDRDATVSAWQTAQKSGEYYVEHRIRHARGGEYRWHQTRAKPVAGASNEDVDWVGTSTDVHEMRDLQERQKVLLAELQHRTRNLLAVVQAIARQTMRASASSDHFASEFEGRLRALSRVQGLLAGTNHNAVDLGALVGAELGALADSDPDAAKIAMEGPRVSLPPTLAQTLALAIHELATNAVKYGALKQPSGELSVSWWLDDGRLVLDWRERNVAMPPESERSRRKGYGMELIERALPYQLKAATRVEFGPDGVHCRIETPALSAGG